MVLKGELDLTLVPQGTLAERIRAGQPLPVAQGPMTRVSDQAAFAAAVAAAGGVPYLALAVLRRAVRSSAS